MSSIPGWLRSRRIGFLCHQASLLPWGEHVRIVLKRLLPKELVLLLAPQHGLFGDKQANMIPSGDTSDPFTGLPVISLYGPRLAPTPEHLEQIDVLLVDLQDMGCRVYTYIWTLLLTLKACAQTGTEVVILDRPNPLGRVVEGPMLEEDFFSFVGLFPLPLRHGLTMGELARFFCAQLALDVELRVVPVEGWAGEYFIETGLPWIKPSPNLPDFFSALVYPGQVLLEGTNLSEGRGTTSPFLIFGAPYLRIKELSSRLPVRDIIWWQALAFEPTFDKWQGKSCFGFYLQVRRWREYRPVLTTLCLLREILALHEEFSWRRPPYEFTWHHWPFDVIVGNSSLREALESQVEPEELTILCEKGIREFCEKVRPFLIYENYAC